MKIVRKKKKDPILTKEDILESLPKCNIVVDEIDLKIVIALIKIGGSNVSDNNFLEEVGRSRQIVSDRMDKLVKTLELKTAKEKHAKTYKTLYALPDINFED